MNAPTIFKILVWLAVPLIVGIDVHRRRRRVSLLRRFGLERILRFFMAFSVCTVSPILRCSPASAALLAAGMLLIAETALIWQERTLQQFGVNEEWQPAERPNVAP